MTHGPLSKFVEKGAAIFLILGLAFVTPALAASSGGGGGGSSGGSPCRAGYERNKDGICVRKDSWLKEDEKLYEKGHALALAGQYQGALAAFGAISDKDDSMVLTMIGYSTRKMGKIDEGMTYYRKALAIDPDNVNTREYLGEAFAEKGRIDLALLELTKIEKVCGTECEQYEDLSAAIAGTPEGWQ